MTTADKKQSKNVQEFERKLRRSQNVIPLFTPGENCDKNMIAYIDSAKKLHGSLFNYGVNWGEYRWNIAGFESTVSTRSVTHDSNIIFSVDNGKGKKSKAEIEKEVPFREPFASEVKAFITHKHNEKPVRHESHMVLINAFRYLYNELKNNTEPSLSQLLPLHFDAAIKYAAETKELANSTLSIIGGKLALISRAIDEQRLTPTPLNWANPIARDPIRNGAQGSRGTKKAKELRAKKLPKTEVLIFLSALWSHYDEIDEKDKALTCMSIILILTGFRMDEFVGLDINCIPSRDEYDDTAWELDPRTGTYVKSLRIRVLAKKKNHWDEKIVPPVAVDTVYEAVGRLKKLSEPHRHTAKMMLEDGKWDKFSEFNDDETLTARQIKDHLKISGSSTSNTISALKRLGIEKDPDSPPRKTQYRVGDIHEASVYLYRERIKLLKGGLGHGCLRIKIWEFLTLRYHNQYTPKERLNAFAEPITGTQIQDFFRGRDYTTRAQKSGQGGDKRRIKSVFERYSFPEFGTVSETVHTHQFRHLLNTLMQESDMFSQEDIAKNFLRKNRKDNTAYNHQIEPGEFQERTRHFQESVSSKLNLDEHQAKSAIQRFPLLSHEELQRDLDESGSYHFMDIGRCRHDYTQSPCGMHYMCLRSCINYKRTKGKTSEVQKIAERRDIAIQQMNLAKEDADDDFVGANNWYLNHKELVEGCDAALAIENNPNYLDGDIVQIFPDGIDNCEEVDDE